MSNNLETLINDIQHISLNQEDLMSCVLDFSKNYSKHFDAFKHREFDNLFSSPNFITQACLTVREAVVLAMQALTLSPNIDFKTIAKECINKEMEQWNIEQTTDIDSTKELMSDFFFELRKECFTATCSQNKELNKVTKLTIDDLDDRKLIYIDYVK